MRSFFFFNDTATTEIYTLSLHDALPISQGVYPVARRRLRPLAGPRVPSAPRRSEEHTSELQSHLNLVCRLLLEKKKVIGQENRSTSVFLDARGFACRPQVLFSLFFSSHC